MISTRIIQHLQPPQSGERVEISDKLNIFSLRSFQCDLSVEKLKFLQELHSYSEKEFQFNRENSAKYSFRAGYSAVELDIEVHDQIYVTPWICYSSDEIGEDLQSLLYMDQWLFAMLKKNNLQV